MTIREAKSSDIDEIRKLGEYVAEFNTTQEVVTFWPEHILRNCVESKTDWLLVAEKESKIIGFIICNNSLVFNKAIIENIFVSPPHRRKGVGKKLLESLFDKIHLTDCEYIAVSTEENNNTAISFYTKTGFNRGENFVWMDKVLSEKFRNS